MMNKNQKVSDLVVPLGLLQLLLLYLYFIHHRPSSSLIFFHVSYQTTFLLGFFTNKTNFQQTFYRLTKNPFFKIMFNSTFLSTLVTILVIYPSSQKIHFSKPCSILPFYLPWSQSSSFVPLYS